MNGTGGSLQGQRFRDSYVFKNVCSSDLQVDPMEEEILKQPKKRCKYGLKKRLNSLCMKPKEEAFT